MKKFVNVYAVTREFAGHEEGGWWYNDFECIKTVQCEDYQVTEMMEKLTDEFQEYADGDIYSSRGGMAIRIYAEDSIAESETTEVPSYA